MDILLCGTSRESLLPMHSALKAVPGVNSVATATNPHHAIKVLNEGSASVAIFPEDSLELGRVLMRNVDQNVATTIRRALATNSRSYISEIRALQYGLDGVVAVDAPPNDVAGELSAIAERRWTPKQIDMQVVMRERGLLNRPLLLRNSDDAATSELIALGLTDEEISTITREDMQVVRNRIADLMRLNQLTHRTQLAILQISHWPSPISHDE